MKKYVVLYSFCTKNGELEQYEDGAPIVRNAIIRAMNTQQALRIFYEQEKFIKKPDYVSVVGGIDVDEIDEENRN